MWKAFRVSAKFPNREELRIEARSNKNRYFKACEKAKRASWRRTVEELEEVKDIARMQKFMENGSRKEISTIMKQDGTYTSSAGETQDELMRSHFDDITTVAEDEEWREESPDYLDLLKEERDAIMEATDLEILEWAINSFSPFKSPGDDGIFPALMQKAKGAVIPILQILFRASLLTGYVRSFPNQEKRRMGRHRRTGPFR